VQPPTSTEYRSTFALIVYLVAFITGAIVMSFEMLGSRYLNPYFGSGIYTWAALISTVLAALCVGYFLGGWLADRRPSSAVLGVTVLIGSGYLLLLPLFSDALLDGLLRNIDDVRLGSLASAFAITFFPVTFLGMYSPFAIRLLLRATHVSGTTSGLVYGISTAGSIVGTLGTTFLLIPAIGSRAITLTLGICGLIAGLVLIAAARLDKRRAALALALVLLAGPLTPIPAGAEALVDAVARAELMKRRDGQLAHIETEYNDIFVTKRGPELSMSFQLKGWDYTQSIADLRDPDALPLQYARSMTTALIYAEEPRRILMVGLGGGSLSTYLARFLPEATIETVELDPGVIAAAKQYFGIRETSRVRYFDGDGRVFLTRGNESYDLIVLDAFLGGYIPFHLLTREFYELVKRRLTPGGAAVFNLHDGTRLYPSAVLTLRAVFPTVHLYPSGQGEVAVVVTARPDPGREVLADRALRLQERYRFKYPLPRLLASRQEKLDVSRGVMLTDDYAPVNLYDAIRDRPQRRK
jgi:spermidine synthase